MPDGEEVLAGEIAANGDALTVRTRQRLMVDLAAWYIGHTIVLAAVLTDLGERSDGALSPQTRAILGQLRSAEHGEGWLEYMRQVLDGDIG